MPSPELSGAYYLDREGKRPSRFTENGEFISDLFDASLPYIPKGDVYYRESNHKKGLENPFDLRNLRFIDPSTVQTALADLERKNEADPRPSVILVGTGGTISMTISEGSKTPGLGVDFLLEYAGRQLNKNINTSWFSTPELIDSSQMKLDFDADIVIALSYIWSRMSAQTKKEFRGFVVAHGTDTMAQSGTRISMMLGPNIDFSVGIVGAQETIENKFNDVADNFSRCIATLDKLYERGRNAVFMYMGGSAGAAYNPAGAVKRSDTDIRAFESQAIPPILDASNTQRFNELVMPFANEYHQRRHERTDFFQPIIVRGYVNSRRIEAEMDIPPLELERGIANYDPEVIAVILETYGSFTFDKQQVDAIMRASREREMLVFATNPFPTGRVDHTYHDARYLIQQGAIPLQMLPHAAAVKLKIGEAIWKPNIPMVKAFMTGNNYVGEQPPDWTPKFTLELKTIGQPNQSLPKKPLSFYP